MAEARFEDCDWKDLGPDVFSLVSKEWMLITAGGLGGWNTMTASWGGFGHLWNRDVAFIFVRPTRHTYGFLEKASGFSLSFLGNEGRKALEICGTVSGHDTDKASAAGLEALSLDSGGDSWVSFSASRLVLGCRKLHAQDLDPEGFVDPAIMKNYPLHDWHRLYVGGIEAAWRRA